MGISLKKTLSSSIVIVLKSKSLIGLSIVSLLVLFSFWYSKRSERIALSNKFSQIQIGITMQKVVDIAGIPRYIDTIGLESPLIKWVYDVPLLYPEYPRCYFDLESGKLVKFSWEPIYLIDTLEFPSSR